MDGTNGGVSIGEVVEWKEWKEGREGERERR